MAASGEELIAIAVEGKVSELFSNQSLSEWLTDASENKPGTASRFPDSASLHPGYGPFGLMADWSLILRRENKV